MPSNTLSTGQKEIINKLDKIKEQNEQIIVENKLLQTQNKELIKINKSFKSHLDTLIQQIESKNDTIQQLFDKINNIEIISKENVNEFIPSLWPHPRLCFFAPKGQNASIF